VRLAGVRSRRGRFALVLAGIGGAVLVASAFSSWVQPARVAWPSYTDGVPDLISHPSDLLFRLAAGLLGVVALAFVAAAGTGVAARFSWLALAAVGAGGIVLGLDALSAVSHDRGFGSMIANDMTLDGFHHGALNYLELAGAGLLCLAPVAALRPARQ
jgi:hypothetical protein